MAINKLKIFKINDFITMKLEDNLSNVYINGRYHINCKFLLLNIPLDEYKTLSEIDSIDRASEKLDHSLEFEIEKEIKKPYIYL